MRFYGIGHLVAALGLLMHPAWAADGPQYPSGAESITSAVAGTVAATQEGIDFGRAVTRIQKVRFALSDALLAAYGSTGELTVASIDQANVLCEARVQHALLALNRSYASAVTAQLQATATPAKITSLLDSLEVIFKHYNIDVAYANPTKQDDVERAIEVSCASDFTSYSAAFYGGGFSPSVGPASSSLPGELEVLTAPDSQGQASSGLAALAAFSALIDAINAIVNPIAQAVDQTKREAAIIEFLTSWRTRIQNVATELAQKGADFGTQRRLIALGQFAEQLQVTRNKKIKLSDVDGCKEAKTGDAGFTTVAGKRVPTSGFIVCFAGIWKMLSGSIAASMKAADTYDQFADASSAKAVEDAQKIKANIEKLNGDVSEATLKDLWTQALRLYAFGKTLEDAFSKERRDAVANAIDNLVKSF